MKENPTLVFEDGSFRLVGKFKIAFDDLIMKINQLIGYKHISIETLAAKIARDPATVYNFLRGNYTNPDTRLIYDILGSLGHDIDTVMQHPIEKLLEMKPSTPDFSKAYSKTINAHFIENTRYLFSKQNIDSMPFEPFVCSMMEKITGRPYLLNPSTRLNLFEVQAIAHFFGLKIQDILSLRPEQLPPSNLELMREARRELHAYRERQRLLQPMDAVFVEMALEQSAPSPEGLKNTSSPRPESEEQMKAPEIKNTGTSKLSLKNKKLLQLRPHIPGIIQSYLEGQTDDFISNFRREALLDREQINAILKGERIPKYFTMENIIKAMGTNADNLLAKWYEPAVSVQAESKFMHPLENITASKAITPSQVENLKYNIRDFLKRSGISVAEMENAASLRIGVIEEILNDKMAEPSHLVLNRIAAVSDCSMEELVSCQLKKALSDARATAEKTGNPLHAEYARYLEEKFRGSEPLVGIPEPASTKPASKVKFTKLWPAVLTIAGLEIEATPFQTHADVFNEDVTIHGQLSKAGEPVYPSIEVKPIGLSAPEAETANKAGMLASGSSSTGKNPPVPLTVDANHNHLVPQDSVRSALVQHAVHLAKGVAAFGAGELVAAGVQQVGTDLAPEASLLTDTVATVGGAAATGVAAKALFSATPGTALPMAAMQAAFLTSRMIDNHVTEVDDPALRMVAGGVQLTADVFAALPQMAMGALEGALTREPLPQTANPIMDVALDAADSLVTFPARATMGLYHGAKKNTDSMVRHGAQLIEAAADLVADVRSEHTQAFTEDEERLAELFEHMHKILDKELDVTTHSSFNTGSSHQSTDDTLPESLNPNEFNDECLPELTISKLSAEEANKLHCDTTVKSSSAFAKGLEDVVPQDLGFNSGGVSENIRRAAASMRISDSESRQRQRRSIAALPTCSHFSSRRGNTLHPTIVTEAAEATSDMTAAGSAKLLRIEITKDCHYAGTCHLLSFPK